MVLSDIAQYHFKIKNPLKLFPLKITVMETSGVQFLHAEAHYYGWKWT